METRSTCDDRQFYPEDNQSSPIPRQKDQFSGRYGELEDRWELLKDHGCLLSFFFFLLPLKCYRASLLGYTESGASMVTLETGLDLVNGPRLQSTVDLPAPISTREES
jgi:hypothetical protein